MNKTMKTLIALLLTIWLVLPLTAFELNVTQTEQQILDHGRVVATYPVSDRVFPGVDLDVANRWLVVAYSDWWSVYHQKNVNGFEFFPYYAWIFVSHTVYFSPDESYELESGGVSFAEATPETVKIVIRLGNETFKWIDDWFTHITFERGTDNILSRVQSQNVDRIVPLPGQEPGQEPEPEPEPEQINVIISLVVNLRFETKSDVTYNVQVWDVDHETWQTVQSVTGTGSAVDIQVPRTADAAILRVVAVP